MFNMNSILLKTINYFVKAEGFMSQKKGAYLHYDYNDCTWIRSGKIIGQSFAVRQGKHKKR